jgi:hypothetical protein
MEARVRALMAVARAQTMKGADSEPFGSLPGQGKSLTVPEQSAVSDLTAWFASTKSVPGQQLPDRLIADLVELGIPRRAAVEAGRLAMPAPLTGRTGHGSPTPQEGMSAARRVAWQEPGMRALFVLNSARRLAQAIEDERLSAQLADEQRYRDAHVAMGRRRRQAARQLDDVASQSHDGWCVWRCAAKPEAVCAALEGRVFKASNPPAIPGAVHMSCRCSAEPWAGPTPGA